MKGFIALLAVGLVTCVRGQGVCADAIAKIPDCARQCIQEASASVGCADGDLKCSCDPEKQDAIGGSAIGCVLKACGAEKGLQVQSAGEEVCKCAATAVPAEPSSTPAPEATTTAAAEASATPESSTPVATTKAPAPSKGSTLVQPSPPFPTGSASRPAGSATAASGTAPGASVTSSSFAPSFTGAAAHAAGSVGGVLGAMVLAMWAL